MRILVYGAGAIGSLFAARLSEAGHDVAIVARGDRLAELRTFGIGLQNAVTGDYRTVRVETFDSLAPDYAGDLIIVALRAHQVSGALAVLAANLRTTDVLFLGHNATGAYDIVGALGWQRPLLGFPGAVASRDRSLVRYAMTPKWMPTYLGELNGQRSHRVVAIAQALQEAGFPVAISPAIDAWLKSHASCIAPFVAALSAADGRPHQLGRTPDAILLALRGGKEAFQVLRARGTPITPPALAAYEWVPEPVMVKAIGLALRFRMASTLLDWESGAYEDECASLLAHLRALASVAGIATPALDSLYDFVSPPRVGLPSGSARVPMDWGSLVATAGTLAGIAALGHIIFRHRK
jgi:2-dehydropantoate 2-reductase